MAFNTTISAILRGRWLIDKTFADSQMPLVVKMITGEAVDFGNLLVRDEDTTPHLLIESTCAAAVYAVGPESDFSVLPSGSIAVVSLTGPMMKYGGQCSYGMVDHAAVISALGNNPNISGIILSIDSPGGQADGTAMLSDVIKLAAGKKPVIAVIEDGMAASAAMWIASACTEIYATQPTDQVGSIGVYQQIANFNKHMLEFKKLEIQDVYAPQSTDKNKNYKDAIAGDVTGIEEDLRVLADQFINTVATNREGKIKGDAWKTGKLFYAPEATKMGLIDGIKSFEEVIARINKLSGASKTTTTKTKTTNMAFEKTLVAAQAESFEVTDGGFLLTEENLNAIEAAITAHPVLAQLENTVADLSTANEIIAGLNTTVSEQSSLVAEHVSTIETLGAQIIELQAQVETLGAASSGGGTAVVTKEDTAPDNAPVASYLDPNNPINKYADKHVKK